MRNGMYDDDNSYPYKKSADNEDYDSEEDAMKKFRIANMLWPFTTAMFESGPAV